MKKKLLLSALIAGTLVLSGCNLLDRLTSLIPGDESSETSSQGGSSSHGGQSSGSGSSSYAPGEKATWTLLFYVCGADLESADYLDDYSEEEAYEYGYGSGTLAGYASQDIDELLAVNGQPNDVNIVLETGGANQWGRSDLNSHKSKLARWDIRNKQLNFREEVSYASMGLSTTLQSFLEWGMKNYPADKYGLFMWNHGGALKGCCFDEKRSDDGLTADEVEAAVSAAKTTRDISNKLEFIAYDACLMAVQDIAEINSHNFKYMISSQESEYAGGYDYDAWLPTLYNNPTTVTTKALLTKIGETFMTEQNNNALQYNEYYQLDKTSEDYWPYDQTQSVYDLSYMEAYKTAFESLASSLSNTASWSTLKTAINKAQKYGYYDGYSSSSSYNYGYAYNVFDVEMAMDEIAKSYSSLSTKTDAVKAALANLVVYEDHGEDTKGCGMNLFCPIARTMSKSDYQSTTNFTNWYSLLTKSGFGNW